MKTMKWIITKLILLITLVILMDEEVLAANVLKLTVDYEYGDKEAIISFKNG